MTFQAQPTADRQNHSQRNCLGLLGLFVQAGNVQLPDRVKLNVEVAEPAAEAGILQHFQAKRVRFTYFGSIRIEFESDNR